MGSIMAIFTSGTLLNFFTIVSIIAMAAVAWGLFSSLGPSNSPLGVFVLCMSVFLLAVLWSNHISNNTWTIFVVVLPMVAGLFQLFLQMVSYVLGNKPFSDFGSTNKDDPASGIPKFLTLVFAMLLCNLAVQSTVVSSNTNSILNSGNYFTDYHHYMYLIYVCSVGMFLMISSMSTGLKNSNKSMKSSV